MEVTALRDWGEQPARLKEPTLRAFQGYVVGPVIPSKPFMAQIEWAFVVSITQRSLAPDGQVES